MPCFKLEFQEDFIICCQNIQVKHTSNVLFQFKEIITSWFLSSNLDLSFPDLDSNKDSGSVTSSLMRMEHSAAAADHADSTIGDANEVLEMLDARSKLK
jgi:hypothetical protein